MRVDGLTNDEVKSHLQVCVHVVPFLLVPPNVWFEINTWHGRFMIAEIQTSYKESSSCYSCNFCRSWRLVDAERILEGEKFWFSSGSSPIGYTIRGSHIHNRRWQHGRWWCKIGLITGNLTFKTKTWKRWCADMNFADKIRGVSQLLKNNTWYIKEVGSVERGFWNFEGPVFLPSCEFWYELWRKNEFLHIKKQEQFIFPISQWSFISFFSLDYPCLKTCTDCSSWWWMSGGGKVG